MDTDAVTVTGWCAMGAGNPLASGMYQVLMDERQEPVLWSHYNAGLKMWGSPSQNLRKAVIFQSIPWKPKNGFWRAKL